MRPDFCRPIILYIGGHVISHVHYVSFRDGSTLLVGIGTNCYPVGCGLGLQAQRFRYCLLILDIIVITVEGLSHCMLHRQTGAAKPKQFEEQLRSRST